MSFSDGGESSSSSSSSSSNGSYDSSSDEEDGWDTDGTRAVNDSEVTDSDSEARDAYYSSEEELCGKGRKKKRYKEDNDDDDDDDEEEDEEDENDQYDLDEWTGEHLSLSNKIKNLSQHLHNFKSLLKDEKTGYKQLSVFEKCIVMVAHQCKDVEDVMTNKREEDISILLHNCSEQLFSLRGSFLETVSLLQSVAKVDFGKERAKMSKKRRRDDSDGDKGGRGDKKRVKVK